MLILKDYFFIATTENASLVKYIKFVHIFYNSIYK